MSTEDDCRILDWMKEHNLRSYYTFDEMVRAIHCDLKLEVVDVSFVRRALSWQHRRREVEGWIRTNDDGVVALHVLAHGLMHDLDIKDLDLRMLCATVRTLRGRKESNSWERFCFV